MSYCKDFGKDKVIFVTKEDHETPSNVTLSESSAEESRGLILPNGEINWNCPCLGGMATGPCGLQFREAFSCFHYSKEEVKGSDCIDKFHAMQECMAQYPTLYPVHADEPDENADNPPELNDANTEDLKSLTEDNATGDSKKAAAVQ